MDMQITITQWNEEYKKLSNLFKTEENNLIKTFLQDDYSLLKLYQTLIKIESEKEKTNFQQIERQLKNYIYEAFSFFQEKTITRANNFDFQSKMKKIDDLFHKIKKDLKVKYDNLLEEEKQLEKEISNYSKDFEELFKLEEKEIKTQNLLNVQKEKKQKEKKSNNSNFDLINKYINNIMNNIGLIENEINNITISDIENIIEKSNNSDLKEIKDIIENITNIIEKKIGGNNLGWQQKEHELFLELRNSFQNNISNYEFLTSLCSLIPYIPSSEHKNHIRNFEKYSQLKEVKKILVKKYQELLSYIEDENKIINLKKNNILNKKNSSDFENKKKLLVKEWKDKKNFEKNSILKKQKIEEKIQKEKEKNLYLINKKKNEVLLNEYRKRKKLKTETTSKENNHNKYKNIFDQIDLERIKQRENILLEKRQKAIRAQSGKNIRTDLNIYNYTNNNTNNNNNNLKNSAKKYKNQSRVINTMEGLYSNITQSFNLSNDKGRNKNKNISKYKSKDNFS